MLRGRQTELPCTHPPGDASKADFCAGLLQVLLLADVLADPLGIFVAHMYFLDMLSVNQDHQSATGQQLGISYAVRGKA